MTQIKSFLFVFQKWCSYDKTVALVNETLSVNTTSGMENATVLVNKTIKVPVEPCKYNNSIHD